MRHDRRTVRLRAGHHLSCEEFMRHPHARWLLPAMLALASATAAADGPHQQSPTPRLADPLDATAPVPPLAYRSTLRAYRRIDQDSALAWREANDQVGRIGGWRAYAREANAPEADAGAAAAPGPGATATPPAHGMHRSH
jgi:hypothetical protein